MSPGHRCTPDTTTSDHLRFFANRSQSQIAEVVGVSHKYLRRRLNAD